MATENTRAQTDKTPAKSRVADSIAQTLTAYGTQFAFGIPGNDVLETIRACEEQGIEFVLAKAEPSAAFMADAVYQLTGKPAALIPALGPGIANAMSGITGALMERSAMIVLSGEMSTRQSGIYNHQVFDHVAMARPVTKYAENLNPQRAAQQVAKALDIATSYPAGPVLLNVAADASRQEAVPESTRRPPAIAATILAESARQAIGERLQAARRPLALIGRGAIHPDAPVAVAEFIQRWQLPFMATYKAKGVVNERDPLCLGSVGLSPIVDAENMKVIRQADLLILIGFDPIELRDAWLDAWPQDAQVLSFDWGPQTHQIFPVGEQAIGHLPSILAQLLPGAGARIDYSWSPSLFAELKSAVAHLTRPRQPAQGISPAALFAEVSAQATPDWIMTVDVGAHRILANHVIQCHTPGQLMQSNGLGCMGYAVPAAIGAQLVHPDRPVVAMLGDGCMLMTQGELAVAAERNLPIVVVILNDSALSLIKLKQSKMHLEPRAVDFKSPRFDIAGQAVGAHGVRVETIEAFRETLQEAVAARRFTVIDALIDPSEYLEEM